jgi:hypothetical protein
MFTLFVVIPSESTIDRSRFLLNRLVLPVSGGTVPAGPGYCERVAVAYLSTHVGEDWTERPAARKTLKLPPRPPSGRQDRERKDKAIDNRLHRLGMGLLDRRFRAVLGPAATWREVAQSIAIASSIDPPSKDQLYRASRKLAELDRQLGRNPTTESRHDLTALHRAQVDAERTQHRLELWLDKLRKAAVDRGLSATERGDVVSAARRGEQEALARLGFKQSFATHGQRLFAETLNAQAGWERLYEEQIGAIARFTSDGHRYLPEPSELEETARRLHQAAQPNLQRRPYNEAPVVERVMTEDERRVGLALELSEPQRGQRSRSAL